MWRWGGAIITSNSGPIDFSQEVCFTLCSSKGCRKNHHFRIRGYNGLPRIEISTEDNQPIVSRKDYLNARVKITNSPETDKIDTLCKIRGRGNSSWTVMPKKSYKIKFYEKVAPIPAAPNKSWVLLAESFDKSLLRWPFMFEVSKAVEMPFTCEYKHVELTLNGDYVGTYLLTEQIERKDNRVVTDKDGYLIENDWYYSNEPLYFFTDRLKLPYTFKYPDADDEDIVENDANYTFIKDYVNNVEKELERIEESDEYNQLIDVNSYAKWYISQELTGNIDPNLFYVMKNKHSKLEAGPVWDADWSLGEAAQMDGKWVSPPYIPSASEIIWNHRPYFEDLLKDEGFRNEVKRVWRSVRYKIPDVITRINKEEERVRYAQKSNFERWPGFNKYLGVGLTAFDTWEEEVDYVYQFFENRLTWFDSYIENF